MDSLKSKLKKALKENDYKIYCEIFRDLDDEEITRISNLYNLDTKLPRNEICDKLVNILKTKLNTLPNEIISVLKSSSEDTKASVSMRNVIKQCCATGCQIDPITKNLPGFKCIKILGEGGFGTTFLMQKGAEKIALKVVDTGPGQSSMQDIENELNMLKKLSTSCAKRRVLCYNTRFDYGNSSFIITEFIDGTSLDKYKFSKPKDFYRVFGQLVDAIEYIHSEGIVHFDIKPQNVMVTNDGDLKIIDFGGAASVDKAGFVRMDTYTPDYSLFDPSVEGPVTLKRGKEYDWYSVIVTIIEIISQNKYTPKDLQPFGEYMEDYIEKLKLVIDSHINSKSKNFLLPKFKSNVRSILEKKVYSSKKK